MRCARCELELQREATNCPRCGTPIPAPVTGPAAEAVAVTSSAQPAMVQEPSESLFGFATAVPTADADSGGPSRLRRSTHTHGARPQMVAIADFGKPPPPAPPPPINWRRRGIKAAVIAGLLVVLIWVTTLAGTQMANFYGGANELRARDRFGTQVR